MRTITSGTQPQAKFFLKSDVSTNAARRRFVNRAAALCENHGPLTVENGNEHFVALVTAWAVEEREEERH